MTLNEEQYAIDTKVRLVYFQVINMIRERDTTVREWHSGAYTASPDDLANDIFTILKMNGALDAEFAKQLTFF